MQFLLYHHTLTHPWIHPYTLTYFFFFLLESATTAASASGALNINQFHSWRQSDLQQ